jgi:hypothetical protein
MGRPRGTGNRKARIIELHAKGWDARTIAARLGLKNRNYVNEVLREASANRGTDEGKGATLRDAYEPS